LTSTSHSDDEIFPSVPGYWKRLGCLHPEMAAVCVAMASLPVMVTVTSLGGFFRVPICWPLLPS